MRRFVLVAYFTSLHLIALLLFSNGFLLTRISLDDVTPIESAPLRATYRKAVILIIDALRHDFTVPNNGTSPYWNQLTALSSIAQKSPRNAFLTKFIADPPTTTLQRLKGLTTGSLPTFIDAGSNFAGEKITEDNLLHQLRVAGKRIAFAGDDTWQALFPGCFEQGLNYPFESLNVWDLDTVDEGVHHHLFDAPDSFFSRTMRGQWDVVISHALGLDHAGHRYGPDHAETTRKLKEMNSWVQELMQSLDDSTLLVVMGDHGMNPQGDHGGDSLEEVEAALFMYSKQDIFSSQPVPLDMSEVAQIDFVSTFALLMGLPIPFNNLGAPISQAFSENPALSHSSALRLTTRQIETYIQTYSEHSATIKQNIDSINTQQTPGTLAWQKAVLQLFRHQWAQYHLPSITFGLIIMFTTFVLLALLTSRPASKLVNYLPVVLFIEQILAFLYLRTTLPFNFTVVGLFLCSLSITLWIFMVDWIPQEHTRKTTWSIESTFAFAGLLLHTGAFASNSFTIHEDRITLLILGIMTIPLISRLIKSDRTSKDKKWALLLLTMSLILSRMVASIRLCREEQVGSCISNFYDLSPWITFPAYALSIWLAAAMLHQIVSRSNNLTPSSQRWLNFAFVYPQYLSWIYWLLEHLEALPGVRMLLARVILISGLGQIIAWYWLPLPVSFKSHHSGLVVNGLISVNATAGLQLIVPLLSTFIFLGRSAGSLSMSVLFVQLLSLTVLLCFSHEFKNLRSSPLTCMILVELMFLHFFSTGHQMALPFIQWDLAFLASKSIIYPTSPVFIAGNAFGSFWMVALWIPCLVTFSSSSNTKHKANKRSTLAEPINSSHPSEASSHHVCLMVGVTCAMTLITFSTMLFAAHFRRHLMVWKIFAPRFMSAGLILLTMDAMFLVSCVAIGLVDHKVNGLRKLLRQAGT